MTARAHAVQATVQRAAEPSRPPERSGDRRRVQPSLQVSHPNDPAEREAEHTARQVMTMPGPAIAARQRVSHLAARAPAAAPAAPDENRTSPELTSAIRSQLGGGSPLPSEVRGFMEPRFNADFTGVRVHTDAKSENLTTRLGARAFTYGRDIFFNAGQFQPESAEGMELIAHELTHTIQQREVVQRQVAVTEMSAPRVQRGIVSRALDWIADKANYIPGYRLFTIVIGLNPINMSKVDRSGANILRALVEFLPGGGLIVEALENYGIFEKGGKFIEDQFRTLGMVGSMFRDALMKFIDSLGWRDVFHLGDVWDRAKRIFTEPVDRLINFGKSLVVGVITIIKDAILKPLAALVSKTRAWDLLCAVMGRNPITGEAVERSADTLIGGFMKLIGQEEIWNNIKKANAISRAWNWFKTALNGLLSLVMSIPGRFVAALKSLVIMDIVVITRVFAKVGGVFAGFIGDFLSWAGGTVFSLLEIILTVVAPGAVPYLKKAGAAFRTIIKDPIRFVRTLVRAAVQGFKQFASNFLSHLKASLVGWLTGALGGTGVYIPQAFSLIEILKFVLSVMGLTWTNIRAKLVKATNETVVKALETGFDIVKTLVTEGPAAAWQKIVETLTNLKEMAIDAVMDFVKSKVVEAAVTKLLSMLSPAGAFIQAIIAIYNTIMFFVERIRQIAEVAVSFLNTIMAIAAGNIAPAANRVEQTMAGLLTLVISFLARIAGLGKVSDAIKGLIDKIRAPIDKALDKVVEWIVATAKKLGKMLLGGDGKPAADTRTPAEKEAAVVAAQGEGNSLVLAPEATEASIAQGLASIQSRHKLTSITLQHDGAEVFVEVVINPSRKTKKRKFDPTKMVVGDVIIVRHREIKLKGGEKITWIPGTATTVDQANKVFNWQSSNLKTPRTWAGVPFAAQDEKWKKGHMSQVNLSEAKLLELNEAQSWDSFDSARAVLNWRHHEEQHNKPGTQWEHIIEQFSDKDRNMSGNLALSASTINNRLGKLFGQVYASHEAAPGQQSTNGKPLRDALEGKPLFVQNAWKRFFYTQLGVSLKWAKSVRGIWRELN